jgi:hypothetical protein
MQRQAQEQEEEDEAPDGYREFLQTLQMEVSGQHSEVRSVFVVHCIQCDTIRCYVSLWLTLDYVLTFSLLPLLLLLPL